MKIGLFFPGGAYGTNDYKTIIEIVLGDSIRLIRPIATCSMHHIKGHDLRI